jgi:hypothetical protein
MPARTRSSHHDTEAPALKTALDERRSSLLAIADQDVDRQPKVDASVAAEIVIGSAPQIAHHREAIVAQFGADAGTMIDELPTIARATKQADVELTAAAVHGDLGPMEADLRAEHTLLITDAQSLANRKLLDPQRLDAARGTLSYRQLIHATLVLVALLREQWSTIEEHTPIKKADLDRTEEKATRMLTTLGEREQGATRVPAAEMRLRALTDLVRRYDEVRRMVSYLRWREGDADDIAPSLYARRAGRRDTTDQAPVPPTPEAPAAPVVLANGAPASPFVS